MVHLPIQITDEVTQLRTLRAYVPGEILEELAETYEKSKRADLDIFVHYAELADDEIQAVIRMELAAYELWLWDRYNDAGEARSRGEI